MNPEKYTVIIVPDDESGTRSYNISRKMIRILFTVGILCITGVIICIAFYVPKIGEYDTIKGNYESLDSFRGQVVVLNFWATWCAPCRVEMPSFEKLYRRYRSEGVAVLAVTLDKNAGPKIKSFVDEYELSFPILLDEKGAVERLYPSMTIPFTYVIDREGRVVARVDGAKNWESNETFEAIEYLLKKP